MAMKTEPRDNLVSSSILLVNNPVSEVSTLYTDSRYVSRVPPASSTPTDYTYTDSRTTTFTDYTYTDSRTTATPTATEYRYTYHDTAQATGPFSYGTYYPYIYDQTDERTDSAANRNCTCQRVPEQETFLHQILMGKGYKNDKLCIVARPIIKQERDYHDYGCCYGYPMAYRYPMYH